MICAGHMDCLQPKEPGLSPKGFVWGRLDPDVAPGFESPPEKGRASAGGRDIVRAVRPDPARHAESAGPDSVGAAPRVRSGSSADPAHRVV